MKFTQIITGQWHTQDNKRIMHTVYALGEDGQVYKYEKQMWKMLNKTVEGSSKLVSRPRSVVYDDDVPF